MRKNYVVGGNIMGIMKANIIGAIKGDTGILGV